MNTDLFKRAATIRHFEETLLSLFSEGKLSGTVHTCIGQELCALAVIDNLQEGDWVFSNHRCHGHYLAWTDDVRGLLAEIMGKPSGICAGRGGSQHIYRDQFLSNGVQGGAVPIAAGCAFGLAHIAKSKFIATAFIGDGTLGQGVVYETLNIIAKWKIPLLIVLEHNGYAQSTRTTETIAGKIRGRFEAFGIQFWETSIWQEDELFATASAAVESVRNNQLPGVLCIDCYRLKAHSKGDDNRESAEIATYLERDPITVFERTQPEEAAKANAECKAVMRSTVTALEAEPSDWGAKGDAAATKTVDKASLSFAKLSQPATSERVVERIRSGLRNLLTKDPRVVLLGEDMEDPYGGAFKATKGLTNEFPGRVRNTPISEAAIVGVGNGLALAGFRPIVEVMFGDFITLATDQLINQASKFAYMYNYQVRMPVIIRTPMGGKRGYGATHSQSLEKHFLGTPGLNVAAVNSVYDPALLLEKINQHLHDPCLLIENKMLYASRMHQASPDSRPWTENGAIFPTLKLDGLGKADLTIVAYGGMVEDVEEAVKRAFIEDELLVEVLVPTMIYPLDIAPIVASVAQTKRLLVVEEGQGFAGFGAEVIAECLEQLPGVKITAARVSAAPHPIPSSRELELRSLPDAAQIVQAIQSLVKS